MHMRQRSGRNLFSPVLPDWPRDETAPNALPARLPKNTNAPNERARASNHFNNLFSTWKLIIYSLFCWWDFISNGVCSRCRCCPAPASLIDTLWTYSWPQIFASFLPYFPFFLSPVLRWWGTKIHETKTSQLNVYLHQGVIISNYYFCMPPVFAP